MIDYVLSGSLIREVEGQPPTPMKTGGSTDIPAKVIHETKNTSTTSALALGASLSPNCGLSAAEVGQRERPKV